MDLLSIGAFARASRLSPKALRLYDELGLLPPAHVDPVTGYRFYRPEQLDRARLVLWLRRLGMPLARIRSVCELDGTSAAAEVSAFWSQVEADTSARRDLAAFLVERLCGAGTGTDDAADGPAFPLRIRYAARSDRGLVRSVNQDAVHAGPRVLAVADGFGTQGAPAGTVAIESLLAVAADPALLPGDLLNALADAAAAADRAIGGLVPDDEVAGTTLTAMVLTESFLALVHIGDSRAYLLRAGELFRITHDHTLVQALVDQGRLSEEEAASHPRRALLLRALDGRGTAAPQIRLHRAEPGDRYLLCSDGLSAIVPEAGIHRVIAAVRDPERAVAELIGLAREAGAPDNVSCVVADVEPDAQPDVELGPGLGDRSA